MDQNFGEYYKKTEDTNLRILLMADGMNAGGAETHIETLARGLMGRGHTVVLFSEGGAVADRLLRDGIRTFTAPHVGRNPFRFFAARYQLRRLIRTERFDVLHAHTRMTALISRKICIPCGRKHAKFVRIVTVHARFRTSPLFRALCDWGDRTIAVSEDLRAYVADAYRVPAECVDVIPNGVDTARFCPPSAERDRSPVRVLFVSRLDADCSAGALLLCEVAARFAGRDDLPRFSITIAGGGSEFEILRQAAERVNQGAGRTLVTLIDPNRADTPDLPDLYRAAHIFVGVSRAAMEAASSGCAVILCGNEGYGGVLSPDRSDLAAGNFCCRGEPLPALSRLAKDLENLLTSPDLVASLASACRAWICRDFSADAMCRATEECYERAKTYADFYQKSSQQIDVTKRICIGGYAGCGNYGDDAILQAIIEGLTQNGVPRKNISALTGNPKRDARRFGVWCAGRMNPAAVLRALRRADVFVCGGGTLMQNRTGARSLAYYLGLLRLARACGCETVCYGGAGPLEGERARRRTAAELNRCDLILMRDEASAHLLCEIGVSEAKIRTGADPAFLLPDPPPARAAFLRKSLTGAQNLPFFCVCPNGAPKESAKSATPAWFSAFAGTAPSLTPVFLAFDRKKDVFRIDALQISSSGTPYAPRDVSELLALVSAARFVVSARLHPLIFAVRAGVPCLGISDGDPKLPAFCRAANVPYLPATASASAVRSAVASLSALPHPCPDAFRKNAEKDLAILSQIVYNKREVL